MCFVYFALSMFVYVIRPNGTKYPLCENGTMIGNGSGLCLTFSVLNLTASDDFLLMNSSTTLLSDLSLSSLLDSELKSQTKSPSDGKNSREKVLKIIVI